MQCRTVGCSNIAHVTPEGVYSHCAVGGPACRAALRAEIRAADPTGDRYARPAVTRRPAPPAPR